MLPPAPTLAAPARLGVLPRGAQAAADARLGARPHQGNGRAARRRSEAEQFSFDFDYGHNLPLLTVEEIAEREGWSARQVYDLAEEGRFLSFSITHDPAPERQRLRIVRATIHTDLRALVIEDWLKTVASIDAWLLPHRREVLTPREVALALRCCGTHVRALYDAGEIAARFIGSAGVAREHLRFTRSSLVEFVRRRIQAKCGLTCPSPMPKVPSPRSEVQRPL